MNRVLVIDDESMICDILTTVLTMDGRYAVATGGSGGKLRALLGAHNDVVAIVCDHKLPNESGIEIQRALEPILRESRIAFVLIHGCGPELRNKLPFGYLENHQIVEVQKPMPSILDIVGIIDREVRRLQS